MIDGFGRLKGEGGTGEGEMAGVNIHVNEIVVVLVVP